jgi:hypothetical protein
VALQSWALWTARSLGLPYSPHAVDGALVTDVVDQQIPRFLSTVEDPDSSYHLGCLYVGTNDVRAARFDAERYETQLREAATFLAQRCKRIVMPNLPLALGRPPNPERIAAANDVIGRVAAAHQALLLDLRAFRGRTVMMADHVHPTAFGQIAIAEQALALLAADGVEVKIAPRELIDYTITPLGQLRAAITYGYRASKERARAWRAEREARRDG